MEKEEIKMSYYAELIRNYGVYVKDERLKKAIEDVLRRLPEDALLEILIQSSNLPIFMEHVRSEKPLELAHTFPIPINWFYIEQYKNMEIKVEGTSTTLKEMQDDFNLRFICFYSDAISDNHDFNVGLVAHELAHSLEHDELDTDILAYSWGFAKEIAKFYKDRRTKFAFYEKAEEVIRKRECAFCHKATGELIQMGIHYFHEECLKQHWEKKKKIEGD